MKRSVMTLLMILLMLTALAATALAEGRPTFPPWDGSAMSVQRLK